MTYTDRRNDAFDAFKKGRPLKFERHDGEASERFDAAIKQCNGSSMGAVVDHLRKGDDLSRELAQRVMSVVRKVSKRQRLSVKAVLAWPIEYETE